MVTSSDNHGFDLNYNTGDDWDYNSEFDTLEKKVVVRDTDANRSNYTPHNNALYIATDTNEIHRGDGTNWNYFGSTEKPEQRLIQSPNGTPVTGLLENGDSIEISIPVADGDTLTVYRWGGYLMSDGTAPSGLDVELLDGGDTVQQSANTTNSQSTGGVASYTNSSGSQSIFKLRVSNSTGNNYTTDGVGGVFAYEVA